MAFIDKTCFSFLDKTLNVLVIDDDPIILDLLRETLSLNSLYTVITTDTAAKAKAIICSDQRIHVCIMDLGLDDIDRDEYFLLKTFGPYISFLVHTGSSDPAQGFKSKQYGAKHLITKRISSLNDIALIKSINYYALLNIVNYAYNENVFDTLKHATDMLFKNTPSTVSQWAIDAGITDRELRYVWKEKIGLMARYALTLYHAFSLAFKCSEHCISNTCPGSPCSIVTSAKYEMLEKYFRQQSMMSVILHRSIIPASAKS